MAIRYTASYSGLRQVMNSPEMQAVMRQVAEKGADYARGIAPVGDPRIDRHSGDYAASFEVSVQANGGFHGDRAEARITNTAEYAAAVEWGDGAFPPYRHGRHVLARTASALGSL